MVEFVRTTPIEAGATTSFMPAIDDHRTDTRRNGSAALAVTNTLDRSLGERVSAAFPGSKLAPSPHTDPLIATHGEAARYLGIDEAALFALHNDFQSGQPQQQFNADLKASLTQTGTALPTDAFSYASLLHQTLTGRALQCTLVVAHQVTS